MHAHKPKQESWLDTFEHQDGLAFSFNSDLNSDADVLTGWSHFSGWWHRRWVPKFVVPPVYLISAKQCLHTAFVLSTMPAASAANPKWAQTEDLNVDGTGNIVDLLSFSHVANNNSRITKPNGIHNWLIRAVVVASWQRKMWAGFTYTNSRQTWLTRGLLPKPIVQLLVKPKHCVVFYIGLFPLIWSKRCVFWWIHIERTCASRSMGIAIRWVCRIDMYRCDKISVYRDAPVNRYSPN